MTRNSEREKKKKNWTKVIEFLMLSKKSSIEKVKPPLVELFSKYIFFREKKNQFLKTDLRNDFPNTDLQFSAFLRTLLDLWAFFDSP